MIYNYLPKINLMKILEEFIKKHIRKSKQKISLFKYRQKNKKLEKKRKKDWYKKNIEKIKVQKKEYRLKNKDSTKIYNKEYNKNNREKIKKLAKDWRLKNPVKVKTHEWKSQGVKSNNYKLLYEKWKNTKNCENCNVELTDGNLGNTKRCLDHSHITGEFRNILCHLCNVRRGEFNI